MRQVPGTHLGPYEILAPLGAGGMGEVYQARDIRAGRELAVKILTRASARHPSRRARFEQEGRAVAALNHPNIVRVHDVGEADGILYIVSELVRGQTLTALMECGRLPLKQLLDLAAQTAEGLAVAHAAGIVHRDLKPANVMVTPEGKVKILDFGLECQVGAAAAAGATMMVAQTDPGVMLGAVNYISPEQARGSVADYRSDQFSFGLILYEMASGQPAFQRGEPVQTMSAILTEEPPPIERNVPAPLRWTIGRCLAKDPGGRTRIDARPCRNYRAQRRSPRHGTCKTRLLSQGRDQSPCGGRKNSSVRSLAPLSCGSGRVCSPWW
jgi:eukaryotic-like serine/threonine-protein kinase